MCLADYLNVVLRLTKLWDGNEVASPRFASLDLGLDCLMALSEGKGFMDITKVFALMV